MESDTLQLPVSDVSGWKYLKRLGWTLQTPRPQHQAAATPDEQQAVKKLKERVATLRSQHPEKPVEIWTENETRLELLPVHRRVWAERGERPIASVCPSARKHSCTKIKTGYLFPEFTNGWAVYNRSGKSQKIEFPEYVSRVSSEAIARRHVIPDLDGEIYLKGASHPADLNSDGVVNIQDLVLVAGKFGETGQSTADVNGDGIVNIQDLVIVANAL